MRLIRSIVVALAWVVFAGAAASQSTYTLKSGDTLEIEVLEDASLNRSVVVLPDGRFTYPLAGTIDARGRTVEQVRDALANAIAGNFTVSPTVYVGVRPAPPPAPIQRQARADPVIDIYVMGEVASSGRVEVSPGTTFLQALAQAGGLTPFAASKRIQLRRIDPQSRQSSLYTINYHALSRGARMYKDVVLTNGDVILVPARRLFE